MNEQELKEAIEKSNMETEVKAEIIEIIAKEETKLPILRFFKGVNK